MISKIQLIFFEILNDLWVETKESMKSSKEQISDVVDFLYRVNQEIFDFGLILQMDETPTNIDMLAVWLLWFKDHQYFSYWSSGLHGYGVF